MSEAVQASMQGGARAQQVRAAVAADPELSEDPELVVGTRAGAAVRWARARAAPGTAVIVDTETTDLFGAIVEIAVVDAASGEVLLDTLVRPAAPISEGAYNVHRISEGEVAAAPTWPEVLPSLLEITQGREVLAYNASYDAQVIVSDCERWGLDPAHLADEDTWGCVMTARMDHEEVERRIALGAGHRARGDALAAREVLHSLTIPPW